MSSSSPTPRDPVSAPVVSETWVTESDFQLINYLTLRANGNRRVNVVDALDRITVLVKAVQSGTHGLYDKRTHTPVPTEEWGRALMIEALARQVAYTFKDVDAYAYSLDGDEYVRLPAAGWDETKETIQSLRAALHETPAPTDGEKIDG